MPESFRDLLAVGGRSNSLGRTDEVIGLVLADQDRLDELYGCLSDEDAWLRMRAADALEKVCRRHPGWLLPYLDRLHHEFAASGQASIQWHLAQIYRQVELTDEQRRTAVDWLADLLRRADRDWILAANAMDTLAQFTRDGAFPAAELRSLLEVQLGHRSKSVVRRADRLLAELPAT